jgi:hypothetical protein
MRHIKSAIGALLFATIWAFLFVGALVLRFVGLFRR